MDFFNQTWFWALLIPAIVTLGSLWITKRYQMKLERIKLYETDQFKAYNCLYNFISDSKSIWPNEEQLNYSTLMEEKYFKNVKENLLFYQPEIRELLKMMEAQYYASKTDPGTYNVKPFEKFFRDDFLDTLLKMEKMIEKKTDDLVQKN